MSEDKKAEQHRRGLSVRPRALGAVDRRHVRLDAARSHLGYDREEYWWAIADPDGTPREAYNLIRADRLNGLLP